MTLGEKHELSALSGILHVDLINTKNKIDQSIKLQLQDGVAWGDFTLPDSLPPGNYRVRAYTQWMRNEGEEAFFYQTIPVFSITNNKIPESIAGHPSQILNNKADIQFFPEGGNLIAGIRSKVAFKAIGTGGLGIDVKGVITDNGNKEVTSFASVHLGMGYFYLNPEEGKTYKAKLTFADGTQTTIDLPKPEAKGITLSINNDSIPKASVRITASPAYYLENKNTDYMLLIYSGGITTTVLCKLDSAVITMDILKRRLHTGIATVTLFSPAGEPLCERLLFIQNYDQLNLDIESDKAVYSKREKVNIKLHVKNRADSAAMGHFSVSVTNESKVPVDENSESTILTTLLLTSDLKGYVEQSNYYFTNTSAAALNNLDLVMLTHGYRRFEWKKLLNNEYPPITWQPEKGLEITGQVKNFFGKPIAKGTITLLPSKGGPLVSTLTDDKGMFRFSNLVFYDTTRFVLSAVNAKGKNSTKLAYFDDKPEPFIIPNPFQNTQNFPDTAMAAYIGNTKKERNEWINYGKGKGILLKEVKIRDVKLDDKYRTQSLAGAGHADQVMHAEEIERIGGQLTTSLNGRLRGVTFVGSPPNQIPVLTLNAQSVMGGHGLFAMNLIIDGAELPAESINYFSSADIETVEVLKYSSASIYGMDGGNGVLIITTKQGGGRNIKDIASIGILPIAPMGFYKAREFYSPKYDAGIQNKRLDLRSTIYWQPEIQTGKDGGALFNYYNADGTGTYKVVIEGIDNKGNLGRRVYRYKVE